MFAFAVGFTLSLAALLLSGMALFQSRALLHASHKRSTELWAKQDARLDGFGALLDGMKAEIRELQAHSGGAPAWIAKPAMNLSKRSQALRLHRRGETTAQIAANLDLPPQEVELLVKIHRIVLSQIH